MTQKPKTTTKKRKVPLLNYNVGSFADYEALTELAETKKKIFRGLLEAIIHSTDKKLEVAEIFQINHTDKVLLLEKGKWKSSLENAMNFFVSIEDYENGIKCRELINNI